MQTSSFYYLFVGAASSLLVTSFFLFLFLATLGQSIKQASSGGEDDSILVLRLLCTTAFLTSAVPFISWELRYGSAFSYFWPLHGIKRIDDYTWRVGLFLKTFFLASIVALLVSFLADSPLDALAEHLNDTELPLLSQLSYVDALLVPLCSAFPIIATLIYTAIPNTTSKAK